MEDSAAKRRAAARREAILGSKGNRLAKLTSSARGEQAAGLFDDPPVPSVAASPAPSADETSQTPRSNLPTAHSPSAASNQPVASGNPALWGSDEQQRQMVEAFMGSLAGGPMGSLNSLAPGLTPPGINTPTGSTAPTDPFSTMMAQLASGGQLPGLGSAGAGVGSMPPMPSGMMGMAPQAVARRKTRLEKLWPLLHVVAILGLLAYFVAAYEPALFGDGHWARWASQLRNKNVGGVHPVPIFYAFTTLELVLHSVRIYLEPAPQPPAGLMGMVIAHLPPPLPGLLAMGSKYLAIGGALLNDLSVLLFGVGVVVWYAGWTVR